MKKIKAFQYKKCEQVSTNAALQTVLEGKLQPKDLNHTHPKKQGINNPRQIKIKTEMHTLMNTLPLQQQQTGINSHCQ